MAAFCPHFANLVEYVSSWTSPVPIGNEGRHNHSFIELVYHKSGHGVVDVDGNTSIEFSAGYMEIIPATWFHSQRQVQPGIDCCILMIVDDLLPEGLQSPLTLNAREAHSLAAEIQAIALLPRAENNTEQQIYNLRLTAVLLKCLSAGKVLESNQTPVSRRRQLAQEAYQHIRIHWRAIHTIDQVASELNVSPDYLRHVFLKYNGITVYDCLTRLRIDHAKDMLLNSQLPQKQIAHACGFGDIQQFSRRFRQVAQMTPGQYRSKHCLTE